MRDDTICVGQGDDRVFQALTFPSTALSRSSRLRLSDVAWSRPCAVTSLWGLLALYQLLLAANAVRRWLSVAHRTDANSCCNSLRWRYLAP